MGKGDHVVVDEESPIYDYCMVLAERIKCRVQSAERRVSLLQRRLPHFVQHEIAGNF